MKKRNTRPGDSYPKLREAYAIYKPGEPFTSRDLLMLSEVELTPQAKKCVYNLVHNERKAGRLKIIGRRNRGGLYEKVVPPQGPKEATRPPMEISYEQVGESIIAGIKARDTRIGQLERKILDLVASEKGLIAQNKQLNADINTVKLRLNELATKKKSKTINLHDLAALRASLPAGKAQG